MHVAWLAVGLARVIAWRPWTAVTHADLLWTWLLQLGLNVLDSMYVVHLLAVGLITPGQPYCVMHMLVA